MFHLCCCKSSFFYFLTLSSLPPSLPPSFPPSGIMYMGLCPGGAEGTALAAIQTFASLAVMTSSNIGREGGREGGRE